MSLLFPTWIAHQLEEQVNPRFRLKQCYSQTCLSDWNCFFFPDGSSSPLNCEHFVHTRNLCLYFCQSKNICKVFQSTCEKCIVIYRLNNSGKWDFCFVNGTGCSFLFFLFYSLCFMHDTWGHELCSFVLTCKWILLWIDVICARYLRPLFQSLKLKDWNSLNVVQLAGFIVKSLAFLSHLYETFLRWHPTHTLVCDDNLSF